MDIQEFISFTPQEVRDLRNTGRYTLMSARDALLTRGLRRAISMATHCSSMEPEERIKLMGSALEILLRDVL